MDIKVTKNAKELTVAIEGRLDTLTSPQLEETLKQELDGIETLILDFAELYYISSAGLRVLLSAMQRMEKQGRMVVRNVSEDVMDVLEVTGFVDDLNIE